MEQPHRIRVAIRNGICLISPTDPVFEIAASHEMSGVVFTLMAGCRLEVAKSNGQI